MKVTTKSSMTTTPMIQIMADQLYRVEKEKEKEKDYLLFHLEEKERYHYLIIMLTMVMGKLERR